MIGEVAGPQRVARAIALDSVTNAGTRMAGPVLGGIVFELLGITGAYCLSAIAQLACVLIVSGLAYAQETRPLELGRIPTDILAGLRAAEKQPIIWMVFVVTVIVNVFAFSYTSLVAPIGSDQFGVSPALVGILAGAEPFGGIIGGAVLAAGAVQLGSKSVFIGGSAVFFLSLITMSLLPFYWLALLVLFLGGLGTAGFSNMQSTLILTEAPADMRSRLLGIVTVCIGTGPLGVLAAGFLANRLGPSGAVLAMASFGLCAVLLTATRVPKF